jgi:hypothetical protein
VAAAVAAAATVAVVERKKGSDISVASPRLFHFSVSFVNASCWSHRTCTAAVQRLVPHAGHYFHISTLLMLGEKPFCWVWRKVRE